MEKNNEKMSRPYVAPETEIVKLDTESIICGLESTVSDDPDDF